MAYMSNQLVSRTGYSGLEDLGDWWDSLKGAAGAVVGVYGQQQQAAGAAAQANRDLQAAMAAQQGISTGTILLIGAAGIAAVLLLRRKKE